MPDPAPTSDDDRDRLLDRFWDEVTDGLAADPAYVEDLYRMRPHLPDDPTTAQLRAWGELADLVRDEHFRRSVREYLHTAFSSAGTREISYSAQLDRIEQYQRIEAEAADARRAGVSPDTPRAREIAERLVASIAGLAAGASGLPPTDQHLAYVRDSLAAPDAGTDRTEPGSTDPFDRYVALMAAIDGTPQPDDEEARATDRWVAAALRAPDPRRTTDPHRSG